MKPDHATSDSASAGLACSLRGPVRSLSLFYTRHGGSSQALPEMGSGAISRCDSNRSHLIFEGARVLRIVKQRGYIRHVPLVPADPCGDRWRRSKRSVDPRKVVVKEMEGHGGLVVAELLGEGICQAREAANLHP